MTKKLKSLNLPETKLLEYLRKHPELFERLNAIVATHWTMREPSKTICPSAPDSSNPATNTFSKPA